MTTQRQPVPGIALQRQRALELAIDSLTLVEHPAGIGPTPAQVLAAAAEYLDFMRGVKRQKVMP